MTRLILTLVLFVTLAALGPLWIGGHEFPCNSGQLDFSVACNAAFYVIGVN